ncbi:MAG: hypothetical protein HC827_12235 [Cyanobacteria bacterium RM1_2_2]|nr:hypothetical protein [Cyanobacteria bacterium RM1_2_2]
MAWRGVAFNLSLCFEQLIRRQCYTSTVTPLPEQVENGKLRWQERHCPIEAHIPRQ